MDFANASSALLCLARRSNIPEKLRKLAESLGATFADGSGLGSCTATVEEGTLELLASDTWEGVAVGFLLAKSLFDAGQDAGVQASATFREALLGLADRHLEHAEPRVRTLVAQTMGSMVRAAERHGADGGLEVYRHFKERLAASIASNYERTEQTIKDAISGAETVAVDDTTGWKALETNLLALKEFIHALGRPFVEQGHLTDELIGYTTAGATKHVNRHVREASFKIIKVIIVACGTLIGDAAPAQGPALATRLAETVALGLQDNWSQVRFVASVANRALLSALSAEDRERFYPQLLPRMCLNRYYMAEGVKLYSQETWKIFMGEGGRDKVGEHIDAVTEYYCWASQADNHVVREAACHSIAEIAVKVAHADVSSHVARLLDALLICFFDESWPVRDAACVATGRFAGAYPEECRPSLDKLYERWFHHASDPIWSVREDSATALGAVCKAYGQEATDRVLEWVQKSLPKAREQVAESPEQYRKKQNDAMAHTGNQLYSCGSLAPKLKKGGCSDCEVTRPSMPWEYSDGAVYLVGELCAVDPARAVTLFEEMAYVAGLTHFVQADMLRETIWKQLPVMARHLGKREFKRHLELFLQPLFDTLTRPTSNQLARHAAGGCIRELSAFVGPSIFRGRLTQDMQQAMDSSPYVAETPGLFEPAWSPASKRLPPPPGKAPWVM